MHQNKQTNLDRELPKDHVGGPARRLLCPRVGTTLLDTGTGPGPHLAPGPTLTAEGLRLSTAKDSRRAPLLTLTVYERAFQAHRRL